MHATGVIVCFRALLYANREREGGGGDRILTTVVIAASVAALSLCRWSP